MACVINCIACQIQQALCPQHQNDQEIAQYPYVPSSASVAGGSDSRAGQFMNDGHSIIFSTPFCQIQMRTHANLSAGTQNPLAQSDMMNNQYYNFLNSPMPPVQNLPMQPDLWANDMVDYSEQFGANNFVGPDAYLDADMTPEMEQAMLGAIVNIGANDMPFGEQLGFIAPDDAVASPELESLVFTPGRWVASPESIEPVLNDVSLNVQPERALVMRESTMCDPFDGGVAIDRDDDEQEPVLVVCTPRPDCPPHTEFHRSDAPSPPSLLTSSPNFAWIDDEVFPVSENVPTPGYPNIYYDIDGDTVPLLSEQI
ncbi:hypothetical protein F5Y16DRAFT_399048 [Xylariaceae sp. FL0255]|nr:hypothetical protein F5Y16DRAFT_399048 [Xylariaceae sp. FL0255]